jgi:hypothetical protein
VSIVRIDPHAHLYDCYSLIDWVSSAMRNLSGDIDTYRMVVIVDRNGQDSFARFRREAAMLDSWMEFPGVQGLSSDSLYGNATLGDRSLTVIRGVQYVTQERLEVLGLGVARTIDDGAPCKAVIESIRAAQGIPCIPWSPGKWLGQRGATVRQLFESYPAGELVFGDIALRSRIGPPSSLLSRAARAGYLVAPGTDPLPRPQDSTLVGSYGVQSEIPDEQAKNASPVDILRGIFCNRDQLTVWGRPNAALTAIRRFIS